MSFTSQICRAVGLAVVPSVAVAVVGLPMTVAAATTPDGAPAPEPAPQRIVAGPVLRLDDSWVLPVESYRLTGRFGMSSSLWQNRHTGLDFAAPAGTPVRAVAAGTVTTVEYDSAYGRRTVVTLLDGTELWFCHQSSQSVSVGEPVAAGDEIGTVGSTGNVTGPHLHLEIRPPGGDPVDPEAVLPEHGVLP